MNHWIKILTIASSIWCCAMKSAHAYTDKGTFTDVLLGLAFAGLAAITIAQ